MNHLSISQRAELARLIANGCGDRKIAEHFQITRHAARNLLREMERANGSALAEIEPRTAPEFAERITACWHRSREAYIEAGRLLCNAKATLDHGEFQAMVETLPFKIRKAEMLMEIYRDQRLVNPQYVALLPNELGTLNDLTRLDDDAFQERVADGTIRPDMERKDVASTIKRERRARRETELAEKIEAGNLALPQKRYGVILADPEWKFETWSPKGMDRAADNHYATSETAKIAARPVADIAAKDCVLFLWATAPMLPRALHVMAAWGFDYKSHIVWDKTLPGTGYWFFNRHELLLLGTVGNVPCPVPGDQWESLVAEKRKGHSEKPDWQYELIESYFPHLPKIELNARRVRENWDSWGAEALSNDDRRGEPVGDLSPENNIKNIIKGEAAE